MDELLKKVAEIRGMPASLIERSARARAEKTGATLEEVLTEWAGGEAPGSPTPPDPTPAPAAEAPAPAGPPDAGGSVPGAITLDSLIALAAETKRMPPKLIQSSAEARSEHSGEAIEAVLAGWAGVDLDELREQARNDDGQEKSQEAPAVAEPEVPDEAPAPAAAVAPVAAAAGAAMSLDELLDKVAEVKGMPASLTRRSAEAKAKKSGESLEAILLKWAELDPDTVIETSGAAQPAEAPPAAVAPSQEPAAQEPEAEAAAVEVIEGDAPEALSDDGLDDPSGSTSSRYPVWLAAAFVLIPVLAVLYILVAPNGPDCGTGGQLLVDPATGNALNCDGSAYGSSTVDHFAAGATIYAQCAACHSADGSGGVGPAFTNGSVLVTFPSGSCSDHLQWVNLGTGGWPDSTYGATGTPVGSGGVMPPFGTSLDEESLAQVVLYERVQFGGQDLAEAEADCGLSADGSSVETAAG